jgi:hypothetical protein
MASPAQIAANQQNALHSTGPRTNDGKEISSQNAGTHRLTARKLLLSIEEQSEFDEIRQGLLEAWNPKTAYERILAEDTVRAHWLWTRAQSAHTAVLESIMGEERKANPALTSDQALARVFTEEKNARRFRLLMRYEAAAERAYRKSLTELQSVITARAQMEAHRRILAARQQGGAGGSACESVPVTPIGFVSHSPAPQRR